MNYYNGDQEVDDIDTQVDIEATRKIGKSVPEPSPSQIIRFRKWLEAELAGMKSEEKRGVL